jgi:hypothetical protein
MTQLVDNFQYGPSLTVGTAAQSKSYAYDEAQYVYSQSVIVNVGPGVGGGGALYGTAFNGLAYVPCFTNKQLRSVTAQCIGTATSGAGDNIQINLVSQYPQAFGTATALSQLNAAVAPGTFYGSSTLLGTSVNQVRILNVLQFSTSAQGIDGTGLVTGGTSAPTVLTNQLPNGTFTVVVVNGGGGTNTQSNYVFPVGPQGGLSVQAGDYIVVTKSATDTLMAYAIELEFTYTPGAYVTR